MDSWIIEPEIISILISVPRPTLKITSVYPVRVATQRLPTTRKFSFETNKRTGGPRGEIIDTVRRGAHWEHWSSKIGSGDTRKRRSMKSINKVHSDSTNVSVQNFFIRDRFVYWMLCQKSVNRPYVFCIGIWSHHLKTVNFIQGKKRHSICSGHGQVMVQSRNENLKIFIGKRPDLRRRTTL